MSNIKLTEKELKTIIKYYLATSQELAVENYGDIEFKKEGGQFTANVIERGENDGN